MAKRNNHVVATHAHVYFTSQNAGASKHGDWETKFQGKQGRPTPFRKGEVLPSWGSHELNPSPAVGPVSFPDETRFFSLFLCASLFRVPVVRWFQRDTNRKQPGVSGLPEKKKEKKNILWMDGILHHLETMGKPWVVRNGFRNHRYVSGGWRPCGRRCSSAPSHPGICTAWDMDGDDLLRRFQWIGLPKGTPPRAHVQKGTG